MNKNNSNNKRPLVLKKELYVKAQNIDLQIETLLFKNGFEGKYGSINHPCSTMAIPITKEGNLLILKQYRFCLDKYIYEFPSGKIEQGEDPESCIIRELEEEVGVHANKIQKIGLIYAAPSYSNEIIHLYIAENLIKINSMMDPDEEIEVLEISKNDIKDLIEKEEIIDSATLAILSKASKLLF